MSPRFDPHIFSRPGRAVPPRPGRERHNPDLESPGPAPQATRRLLQDPVDDLIARAKFYNELLTLVIIVAAAVALIFALQP